MPAGAKRRKPLPRIDPHRAKCARAASWCVGARKSACYTRIVMGRRITATITVEGDAALLAAFRRRANELLDAEFGERYRELHADGRLDWRVKAAGVPYPPFVTASEEVPDLVVEVRWEDEAGGTGGRSTIQAGRLAQQAADPAPAGADACELRADRGRNAGDCAGLPATAARRVDRLRGHRHPARLLSRWAPACSRRPTAWRASGPSAGRSTGDGADYAELEPREPIDAGLLGELDRLANGFAADWLWFDESPPEETAVERARYAAYGFKVNARERTVGEAQDGARRAARRRVRARAGRPRGARDRCARGAVLAADRAALTTGEAPCDRTVPPRKRPLREPLGPAPRVLRRVGRTGEPAGPRVRARPDALRARLRSARERTRPTAIAWSARTCPDGARATGSRTR